MDKGILRGWKEIEDFTGMTRKTALHMGLPVHKARGAHGFVWTTKREIEEALANGRCARFFRKEGA